jgi:hypothetical protein
MSRRIVIVAALMAVCGAVVLPAAAQEVATSTPAQIDLSTAVPADVAPELLPSPTWTPTEPGPALLEPLDIANVRAEPDTAAEQLGVIRNGETYPITGRYFGWIQFLYDPAPNDRGWVFGELVSIIGDENAIPELELEAAPTIDPVFAAATETQAVITLTPGAESASSREIEVPRVDAGSEGTVEVTQAPILPTFTYPPGINAVAPTQRTDGDSLEPTDTPTRSASSSGTSLPPIVPILILGGLGLLGLAVSVLRR